jgi:uncharacterized membrane protein
VNPITRARLILLGHQRLFAAIVAGALSLLALPPSWPAETRLVAAWDIGATCFLALAAILFSTAPPERMPANAEAQEEGEWTLFWLVMAGAIASFGAIIGEFSKLKGAKPAVQDLRIALVAATLILTWLFTQAAFALRYAHEYYSRGAPGRDGVEEGLQFPDESRPDYWDFFYFSAVLGMTFQVSDVQITSRKLRRLATVHGLLGFLFNTVIVALTVNLAAGLV